MIKYVLSVTALMCWLAPVRAQADLSKELLSLDCSTHFYHGDKTSESYHLTGLMLQTPGKREVARITLTDADGTQGMFYIAEVPFKPAQVVGEPVRHSMFYVARIGESAFQLKRSSLQLWE